MSYYIKTTKSVLPTSDERTFTIFKLLPRDLKVVHMFARYPWQRDLPSWYPPFPEYNSLLLRLRHLGLFTDEHLDFKEKMDSQRSARGKAPPKKGRSKCLLIFTEVQSVAIMMVVLVAVYTGTELSILR